MPVAARQETDPRIRCDSLVKLGQFLALVHRCGFIGRSEARDTLRQFGVPLRPELDNPGEFTFELMRDEYPGLDQAVFTDEQEAAT